MRRTVLAVAVSVLLIPAQRASALPITEATVRSPIGLKMRAGTSVIATGIQITDVSPGVITIGSFDATGHLVGGDAVLVAFADLGTAPLDRLILPGTNGNDSVTVTPASPLGQGVVNSAGFVLPPDFPEIMPSMLATQEPIGTEGVFFLGLAFLTSAHQPLSEALGVTVPYRILIGDDTQFLQDPPGRILFNTPMTIGGAAHFAISVSLPATLVLLMSGLVAVAAHRTRA